MKVFHFSSAARGGAFCSAVKQFSKQATSQLFFAGSVAFLCLSMVLLSGCRSGGTEATKKVTLGEIEVPPGVSAAMVAPIEGDALLRAQTPAAEVWASLAEPAELANAVVAMEGSQGEPPLAAQRAYMRGRTAWREGDREQAVASLEQALRLTPTSSPVLRLLGEIYLSSGNPIRGQQHLSDAVRHDPTHAPSLLMLGRLAMESGDWERGVALMHEALQHAGKRAQAMEKLGLFYLAVGLENMGYLQLATEQYQLFLAHPARLRGTPGVVHELAALARQDRQTWRRLGDLHSRLGELPEAMLAYRAAVSLEQPATNTDILRRIVYTQLRLGHADEAANTVLNRVRDSHGRDSELRMVRYLAEQGVAVMPLVEALRAIRQQDPGADQTALTIATAELLPAKEASALLDEHLAASPGDVAVFARLLERSLYPDGLEGERAYGSAIRKTAELMEAHPQQGEAYGLTFLRVADDLVALQQAFETLPGRLRSSASVRVLEGLTLAGLGEVEAAAAAFGEAVELSPSSHVARLQLAKVMVARGQFQEAAKLLDAIEASDDPSVVSLRVRVLTETGQPDEALALIDQALEKNSLEISLIVQKARLLVLLDRGSEAERALLDALNLQPANETLYELLFQMYDARDADGRALIDDADTQYRRLMRRMLGVIPDSRIGKLKRAELHAAGRQYGEAVTLLKSLVSENPRDLPALKQLLEVLIEADARPQAVELMENIVKQYPRDPEVLQAAAAFYGEINDRDRLIQTQEKLYALLPEGDDKRFGLAALYYSTDRADQAIQLLEPALDERIVEDPVRLVRLLAAVRLELGQEDAIDRDFIRAIKTYSQAEADLRYSWASTHSMLGDFESYVGALEENHRRFPQHAGTNNDLGYLWVEENKNLDQALAMIRAAVETDPDNAAFLDSLGWAYYKLGRFDDAVVWLRKSVEQAVANFRANGSLDALATQAVVLDHLGDALYRQGILPQANATWLRAQRVFSNLTVEGDSELQRVKASLAAKIDAHKNQLPVPVAALPGEE